MAFKLVISKHKSIIEQNLAKCQIIPKNEKLDINGVDLPHPLHFACHNVPEMSLSVQTKFSIYEAYNKSTGVFNLI